MNLVCEKLTDDEIRLFVRMVMKIRRMWSDRPFLPRHALRRYMVQEIELTRGIDALLGICSTFSDSQFDFVLECFSPDAAYPVVDVASNIPLVMAHQEGKGYWRVDAPPSEVIEWWHLRHGGDSTTERRQLLESAVSGCGFANLKAYGEPVQPARIKPITLLFGKNSAGKSSFLHGLLMLNHAMKTSNLDVFTPQLAPRSLDLGGFTNLLRERDVTKSLVWSCEVDLPDVPAVTESWLDPENAQCRLEVEFGFQRQDHRGESSSHGATADQEVEPIEDDQISPPMPLKATLFIGGDWFAEYPFMFNSDPYYSGWARPVFNRENPALVRALKLLADRAGISEPTADDLDFLAQALYHCTDSYGDMVEAPDTGRHFLLPYVDGGLDPARDDNWFAKVIIQIAGVVGEEYPEKFFGADWQPVKWADSGDKSDPRQHKNRKEMLAQVANESKFASVYQLLKEALDGIASWVGTFAYVGPHRERNTDSFAVRRRPSMAVLEPSVEKDPWLQLERNEKTREVVNQWMMERFHTPYYVSLLYHVPWDLIVGNSTDAIASRISLELFGKFDTTSSSTEGKAQTSDSTEAAADTDGGASASKDLTRQIQDVCINWGRDLYQRNKLRQEVVLIDRTSGLPHKSTDLGYGISQVLPVVVASLAQSHRTILIEQPELHLHPAMQCELADLFIEGAMGETQNRFILETHSEHLILRLLRRIRETANGTLPDDAWPITPEDVAVVYAEPTEEGTILHEMKITDDGDFEEDWPEGFFEERLDELF